jgi:transcriptional regulator with XRE-family HTH domain
MPDTKTVGFVAKTLAEKAGLTLNAFARKAGLAPSTLWNVYQGTAKTVRPYTLKAMADALGVRPEDLESEAILNSPLPLPQVPVAKATPVAPANRVPVLKAESVDDLCGENVDMQAVGEKAQRWVAWPPFPVATVRGLVATEVKRGMAMEPDVRVGDILYLILQPTGYAPIYEELVLAMAPISRLPVVRRYGGDKDLMDADGRRIPCDRVLATVCALARWDI